MNNAPHAQAAFINVIADEGTKAEAVEWLQKTWNEHMALVKAVRAIYFAAYWHPDRPLKHEEWLWTTLRDAAGITPGESSKQLGPDQSLRPEGGRSARYKDALETISMHSCSCSPYQHTDSEEPLCASCLAREVLGKSLPQVERS